MTSVQLLQLIADEAAPLYTTAGAAYPITSGDAGIIISYKSTVLIITTRDDTLHIYYPSKTDTNRQYNTIYLTDPDCIAQLHGTIITYFTQYTK